MKIKLSNLVFAFLFVTMAIGCSKSEPPVEPPPPTPTLPTTPPVIPPPIPPIIPPVSQVKWLPVKIESTQETIIIKYKEKTGLITSIEESQAGKKHFISYNADDTLFGYELYENNEQVYFTDYWDDSNLRINYVTQFKNEGKKTTPLGRYTLDYNALNQLTDIKYYSAQKVLLRTKILSYDAAANVNSILTTEATQERTTFTFDQQNGIFKHVDNALLISLEMEDKFFNSIHHNVLTITGVAGSPGYNYAYEYNADAYPNQVTLQESNINTIFRITYKPL